MARPRAVPAADSRESPSFWARMIEADAKRRERQNEQFARFARWHRGDLGDIVNADAKSGPRWENALENMTFLATEASKADQFFRWPRFVVRPPYASQHPLFSPEMARIETTFLTHSLRTVAFRRRARRALQDALLGGLGILKVTIDAEVALDEETLEAAKMEAQQEIASFVQGNPEAMRARESQIHSIHLDIKRGFLTQAERGEIQLPKAALKYLRRHIKEHEAMKGSERPTESIRSAQIRVRRVNPLDYCYDPTVDDRDDATWRASCFLMRRSDILANSDFDRDARLDATTATDRWENRPRGNVVKSPGTYDIPEEMCKVWEVFDLVAQVRRLYVDGATRMLIDEDRHDLAFIQPSGPFHELVFIEDTMEGQGIPPPSAFEGEQAAATHLASSNVAAAIQSTGRTMYDGRFINPDEAEKVWQSPVGSLAGVKPNAAPDKKLQDFFADTPPAKIEEQNMAVLADLRRGVDRRSGLGTAKMGGGEQQATATGAALGAEASTSISDDRASSVEEWCESVARTFVRLTRRFIPKSHIVEVCGIEAAEVWPDRALGLNDCANDIGVEIIPGSARRNNTAIDQKLLLDGIQAFGSDPTFVGPAAQRMKIEMFRRYFEDGGVSGLDWGSLDQEVVMQAMQQQMMAAQGGGPGDEDAPEPTEDDAESEYGGGGGGGSEGGAPTSSNDMLQGVANVGGGRVPTNASIGDKVRLLRQQATQNVVNRGA